MFGAAPNSLAELASSCSKDGLAAAQLCDCGSTGFHMDPCGQWVHPYGGSPEAEASCCPPSLDALSVLCLRGVLHGPHSYAPRVHTAAPSPEQNSGPALTTVLGRERPALGPAPSSCSVCHASQRVSSSRFLKLFSGYLPGVVVIVSGHLALALLFLQQYLSSCVCTV